MSLRPTPYAVPFDLGALSDRGQEFRLEPAAPERAAIAAWLGVTEVQRLKAQVRLSRQGGDHYRYQAGFEADIVQACVVTLEPVPSHLISEFSRDFRLPPRQMRRPAAEGSQAIINLDEDEPELLESSMLDLAAPILEELSLALEPYPRAPGVAFKPAAEPDGGANPFAVLVQLKTKLRPSDGGGKGAKAPGSDQTKDE